MKLPSRIKADFDDRFTKVHYTYPVDAKKHTPRVVALILSILLQNSMIRLRSSQIVALFLLIILHPSLP